MRLARSHPQGARLRQKEASGNSRAHKKPPRPFHMSTAAPLIPPTVAAHPVPGLKSWCQDKLRWAQQQQPVRAGSCKPSNRNRKPGLVAAVTQAQHPHQRSPRICVSQQATEGCRPPRGLPSDPHRPQFTPRTGAKGTAPPRSAPTLNYVPRLQAPGSACF